VAGTKARVVTNIRRRLSSGGPGIEMAATDSALLAVSTQSCLPEGSTNDTKDCEDSPLSQRTGLMRTRSLSSTRTSQTLASMDLSRSLLRVPTAEP